MNLTTCTHGAHKIHSCKNKGVHTAKPFRVYRRGPWPRVQMRPLTTCTDEAVTLATLARTIRVYLRPWPRTIRVYLRPQKARAQATPWPIYRWWNSFVFIATPNICRFHLNIKAMCSNFDHATHRLIRPLINIYQHPTTISNSVDPTRGYPQQVQFCPGCLAEGPRFKGSSANSVALAPQMWRYLVFRPLRTGRSGQHTTGWSHFLANDCDSSSSGSCPSTFCCFKLNSSMSILPFTMISGESKISGLNSN